MRETPSAVVQASSRIVVVEEVRLEDTVFLDEALA
jgi:hypothetical protein